MKKKRLKTLRATFYEKRKIRVFPKGLVHCFGLKVEIFFLLLFLCKIN